MTVATDFGTVANESFKGGGTAATDFEKDFFAPAGARAAPVEAEGAAVFGLRFSSPCNGMWHASLDLAPPASSRER
jgi:hypothetical protein